jgi:hypothetical protein
MTSGSYGLIVALTASGQKEPLLLQFSSDKDMFGNPYGYSAWTLQEQIFKLPATAGVITSVSAFLYQDNRFTFISD